MKKSQFTETQIVLSSMSSDAHLFGKYLFRLSSKPSVISYNHSKLNKSFALRKHPPRLATFHAAGR